jgi:type II secretory pathway pseudopilin PulG
MIELVVIIAIIGILTSIAIPVYSGWLPRRRLKAAAGDIYSNLQSAKMKAIKENGECAVVFDRAGGNYEIECGGPDRDYSLTADNVTQKTVSFSDYGYGIGFGIGDANSPLNATRGFGDDVTFDDPVDGTDLVVFNSRGMTNTQTNSGGEVYISNNKNETYVVSGLMTGIIILRRWNGAGWQ